jgi:hypothetical protein
MNRVTFLVAGLFLLTGCAGTTPMTLGPDHPANPDAPEAPVPSRSTVLAVSTPAATAPASPATTTPGTVHDAGHAHHGAAATQPAAAGQARVGYTCPHHPEVVSDQPGKCSKCGMNLVKKDGAR